MIFNKTILVLAPHTDDGELGCGGSITKFAKNNNIYYVAFSSCQRSLPKNADPNTLIKEVTIATKILGINKQNLILFDYQVRDFPENRQSILDEMIVLRNNLNPDLVFLPSPTDIHQDHKQFQKKDYEHLKTHLF